MVSKREIFESLDASEDIIFLSVLKSHISIGGEQECWKWNGPISTQRLPVISRGGKQFQVRRLVCQIYNHEAENVRRISASCGNDLCVNPFHAEMGCKTTMTGRTYNVSYKKSRKISNSDVVDIKRLASNTQKNGLTQREIASQYGVSPAVVCYIKNKERKKIISSSAPS